MRLVEFQAKELFGQFGIKTPKGRYSKNIEEAREHAKELGFPFVIKIQVPVGGRGKAGGIQKCQNQDEFELKYPQVAGMTIKGEKARAILLLDSRVAEAEEIFRNPWSMFAMGFLMQKRARANHSPRLRMAVSLPSKLTRNTEFTR